MKKSYGVDLVNNQPRNGVAIRISATPARRKYSGETDFLRNGLPESARLTHSGLYLDPRIFDHSLRHEQHDVRIIVGIAVLVWVARG